MYICVFSSHRLNWTLADESIKGRLCIVLYPVLISNGVPAIEEFLCVD